MAADRRQDLAPTVRAAALALGDALGKPVRVTRWRRFTKRGRRNALIRCYLAPVPGVPASVVVKQALPRDGRKRLEDDARQRLRQDWAGAAMLTAIAPKGIAPRLLAGHYRRGFIVLEDRGERPGSLVRPLLGKDRAAAAAGLVALAQALGQLHAATAGRESTYDRIVHALDPSVAQDRPRLTFESAVLARLHAVIDPAPGFWGEMLAVRRAVLVAPPYRVLRHGDPCPDNVMYDARGLMLHDFEFARFGHPLIDAAYFRLNFPSCWCAGAIPATVVARCERAYRRAIAGTMPKLADEKAFERELATCAARWMHLLIDWSLAGCLEQDRRWGIAGTRARLLTRIDAFIALSARTRAWPAHRATIMRLRDALRLRWPDTGDLPPYAAFGR